MSIVPTKYAKLPTSVLIKKATALKTQINGYDVDFNVSVDLNDDVERPYLENLCIEMDEMIRVRKMAEKEKQEKEKQETQEMKKQQQIDDIDQSAIEQKKEYPTCIPHGDFTNVKNAYGVVELNDAGEPVYCSLQVQFVKKFEKCPNLILYRATLKNNDSQTCTNATKFMRKNLNRGFANMYQEHNQYIFASFQLWLTKSSQNLDEFVCSYTSWWIFNTPNWQEMLGADAELWEWTEVTCPIERMNTPVRYTVNDPVIPFDEQFVR